MNKKIIIVIAFLSAPALFNAADKDEQVSCAFSFLRTGIDFCHPKNLSLTHDKDNFWILKGHDDLKTISVYEESEGFIKGQKAPFLLSYPTNTKDQAGGLAISITEVNGKKLTIPLSDYTILSPPKVAQEKGLCVANATVCFVLKNISIDTIDQNINYICTAYFDKIIPGNEQVSKGIPLQISGEDITRIHEQVNSKKENLENLILSIYGTYFSINSVEIISEKANGPEKVEKTPSTQKAIKETEKSIKEGHGTSKKDATALESKTKWYKKPVVLYTTFGVVVVSLGAFLAWYFSNK